MQDFLELILLPYRVLTMPFIWLYRLSKLVFLASRVVGFVVIAMYLYQMLHDLDYALVAMPATEAIPWFRMALVTKTIAAAVFYGLFMFVLTATDRRPRYKPERVFPHSQLLKAKPPRFQANLYGFSEGHWLKSGQAFLFEDCLITANHVVSSYDRIRISTDLDELEVDADVFSNVEGDLAIARMSGSVAQKLGLKPCKLVNVEPENGAGLFVKADGFEHSSMGLVEPHKAFGFVKYSGSTIGGFSGCPYYCSNKVYGMHLGGNTENLGYSAAYIYMLISYFREDTEDFVIDQAQRYGKYQVQASPYDPDEFRVKVGGRFYMIDGEGLARLRGGSAKAVYVDRYASDYAFESLERPTPVAETPPPPKPADTYTKPVVEQEQLLLDEATCSSFLGRSAGVTPAPGPIKETAPVASPRRPKLSVTISSTRQKNSDGLESMLAQREGVFQGISKFTKKLKHTTPRLQPLLSNKRLKELNTPAVSTQLASLHRAIETSLLTIGSSMDSLVSMLDQPQA